MWSGGIFADACPLTYPFRLLVWWTVQVQVWGAAEIHLGCDLTEKHKRILLLVLKVHSLLVILGAGLDFFVRHWPKGESTVQWSDSTESPGPERPIQPWCVKPMNHTQDSTMLVQGQRSFSHEEFREVVYSKYIQSPEAMVRLHILMARYFARLPASDRKVSEQGVIYNFRNSNAPHLRSSTWNSNISLLKSSSSRNR